MIHPAPPPTLPAATSPAQPIASVRWDGDAPVVIDQRIVGCDRVAANGDTANKIGTYNLALVARAHNVPFYVVGPLSTLDLTLPHGDAIPIEERDPAEVTQIGAEQITPNGVNVANPTFDVTPAHLITAIITEAGIAYPPYTESLARLVEGDEGAVSNTLNPTTGAL